MTPADVQSLRDGDEDAFRALVATHQRTLMRLATVHTGSVADAEEVVQETWLAVLQGIDGFEGRASLRTWICRILLNIARRRAGQQARSIPMSALSDDGAESSVDPDRFEPRGPNAGHWRTPPQPWRRQPEELLLADEMRQLLGAAVRRLGPAQQEVIILRDVEGWSSTEVCELLDIAEGHQRVLLHRARSRVRQTIESYLDRAPTGSR